MNNFSISLILSYSMNHLQIKVFNFNCAMWHTHGERIIRIKLCIRTWEKIQILLNYFLHEHIFFASVLRWSKISYIDWLTMAVHPSTIRPSHTPSIKFVIILKAFMFTTWPGKKEMEQSSNANWLYFFQLNLFAAKHFLWLKKHEK